MRLLAEHRLVRLFTSAVSFANINYLLQKQYGRKKTREHLQNLKVLVVIIPTFDHTITAVINSSFNDTEDAIQYFTALENNLDVLVTRNVKDYVATSLPVLTPAEYLKNFTAHQNNA